MPDMIQKIADDLGVKITYKPYRMWHSVPHINNTALCVDEIIEGGGHRLITDCRKFPYELTEQMVLDAIDAGAYSLGRLVRRSSTNPAPGFTPWYNLINNYPAGYHTHRVGIDVPSD